MNFCLYGFLSSFKIIDQGCVWRNINYTAPIFSLVTDVLSPLPNITVIYTRGFKIYKTYTNFEFICTGCFHTKCRTLALNLSTNVLFSVIQDGISSHAAHTAFCLHDKNKQLPIVGTFLTIDSLFSYNFDIISCKEVSHYSMRLNSIHFSLLFPVITFSTRVQ